jgi:hypothetical protein
VIQYGIKRYINAEWAVALILGLPSIVLTFASLYGMIQVFWDKVPHKLKYWLLVRFFLVYLEDKGNKCLQNFGK